MLGESVLPERTVTPRNEVLGRLLLAERALFGNLTETSVSNITAARSELVQLI